MDIKICDKCGIGTIKNVDTNDTYETRCDFCTNIINRINKKDFIDNFECTECGGLSGKIEENATKLGVRCENCGKLHIMLEKNTDTDLRRSPSQMTSSSHYSVRCPKCGSTDIQMVQRKFSLLAGFATNKVDRVCVNCKHKF